MDLRHRRWQWTSQSWSASWHPPAGDGHQQRDNKSATYIKYLQKGENTTEVKFAGTMIFSLLITSVKTHPRANWILLPTKHYWYIFSRWWIFMLMMIDSIMKTSQSYHHPQFTDAWIWPRGFPLEQLHQEESFHCCRFFELFAIFSTKDWKCENWDLTVDKPVKTS